MTKDGQSESLSGTVLQKPEKMLSLSPGAAGLTGWGGAAPSQNSLSQNGAIKASCELPVWASLLWVPNLPPQRPSVCSHLLGLIWVVFQPLSTES